MHRKPTYISLFSCAGIGCYGFKQAGFTCAATVELNERRLAIQKVNNKCPRPSGYICGDMTKEETHDLVREEVKKYDSIDVIIATPPCQGMSVANLKKGDEKGRNSLVVESLKMISEINPKFFILENVRSFLKTICTDVDGADKTILDAIRHNLSGKYSVIAKVINFKDFGCPSSRTRTLVIGTRTDLNVDPMSIFPDKQSATALRYVIGHLPKLTRRGESHESDILHNFRDYPAHMESWVADLAEGHSAFENEDPMKRPHRIINGQYVPNVEKNGDKYKRQRWDHVAPCVHTRMDTMSSQNTIHPSDNRVFSIRELMLMMSVPHEFRWSEETLEELNGLSPKEQKRWLAENELNIRFCLGESVPTTIFKQIADKIMPHMNNSLTNLKRFAKMGA